MRGWSPRAVESSRVALEPARLAQRKRCTAHSPKMVVGSTALSIGLPNFSRERSE